MGGREDGRTDSEWQTFVLPNAREVKRSGACKMVSDREKGTIGWNRPLDPFNRRLTSTFPCS